MKASESIPALSLRGVKVTHIAMASSRIGQFPHKMEPGPLKVTASSRVGVVKCRGPLPKLGRGAALERVGG